MIEILILTVAALAAVGAVAVFRWCSRRWTAPPSTDAPPSGTRPGRGSRRGRGGSSPADPPAPGEPPEAI